MGSKRRRNPAAFHDALSVKSSKRKQGLVRGSRAAQNVKARKDTLLVEYRSLRKANSFTDGRQSMNADPDARALQRFQAQRAKGKRASKFDLSESGEGFGTDLGGGFEADCGGSEAVDPVGDRVQSTAGKGRKKTKREAMRELIAKSKMHRHNKVKEAEEISEAQVQLDKKFTEMMDKNVLAGCFAENANEMLGMKNPSDHEYDRLMRELATESSLVYASERTETQEEVELKKQKVLRKELLSKEKRMTVFSDEDDDDGDDDLDGRKKRQKIGQNSLRDGQNMTAGDEYSGYDKDSDLQVSALDQRRQMRASGDDPLQVKFRKLTDALLRKCTGEDDDETDEETDVESGDHDGDDAVEENSAGDSQGSLSNDENELGSDEHSSHSGLEVASLLQDISPYKDEVSAHDKDAHDLEIHDTFPEALGLGDSDVVKSMFSDEDADGFPNLRDEHFDSSDCSPDETRVDKPRPSLPNLPVLPLKKSYPIPRDYEEFAGWVSGQDPEDVARIISIIRVSNHKELNAAVKMKLEELLSIVWEYFGVLASERKISMRHLDILIAPMCDIARDVPFHAGSISRKELKNMQNDLLQDLQGTILKSGWPTTKSMMYMKLMTVVFPVSDRFHPVSSALALLVGQYLAQCSVSKASHIAKGLFLAVLSTRMAMPALRYSFEPLAFLSLALKNCTRGAAQDLLVCRQDCDKAEDSLPVEVLLETRRNSRYYKTDRFKVQAARLALACLKELVGLHRQSISFPEAFLHIVPVLEKLEAQKFPNEDLQRDLSGLLAVIKRTIKSTSKTRKPLVQKFRLAIPEVKQFNPRIEEVRARSSEPGAKDMKRKLNMQRRGAMKELRKDAVFMARVRESEKTKVDKERMESERKFYKELNAFEQDWKSGGQGGMNPHLRKKKKQR